MKRAEKRLAKAEKMGKIMLESGFAIPPLKMAIFGAIFGGVLQKKIRWDECRVKTWI